MNYCADVPPEDPPTIVLTLIGSSGAVFVRRTHIHSYSQNHKSKKTISEWYGNPTECTVFRQHSSGPTSYPLCNNITSDVGSQRTVSFSCESQTAHNVSILIHLLVCDKTVCTDQLNEKNQASSNKTTSGVRLLGLI